MHNHKLKQRDHILLTHHPDTLTSRYNLANAYQDTDRLLEAITLFEQNLKESTHILGPDHPNTLLSRNNLAEAYRAAGRIEDAEKLFERPSGTEEDEQNGTKDDSDQETSH